MPVQKPKETRKWTQTDIQELKEALPDSVSFATLSAPDRHAFHVHPEFQPAPEEIVELSETLTDKLGKIGVPVDKVTVDSGYNRTQRPVVLLTIHMK